MNKIAIGEVCNVYDGPHATPTKIEKGPIYLGIDAITDSGKINPAGYNYLSDEDYVKWTKRVTPQYGDIVFSYEATLGRYALIPKEFYGCLGRRLAIVRPKDERINVKWLFYYFRSTEWSVFIKNNTVKGSTVDRISVEDFPKYKIPLVNREKQDKIVAVLSAIDDKIDNNQTINDNLQQQANIIFDYWFTQFNFPNEQGQPYKSSGGRMTWNIALNRNMPDAWDFTTVGCITNCLDSKRIPLSSNERLEMKGSIPYYGATGIMDYVNKSIFNSDYILIAEDGSVMNKDGNPILQRISGECWINNHAHVLEPVNGYSCILLYMLIKNIPVVQIKTGSIQMKINQENLNNYRVINIPDNLRIQFSNILEPLDKKMLQIQKENSELVKLRDWLLPMLMNGQATIGD